MAADYPGATYSHTGGAADATLTQDEWNRVGENVQALTEQVGTNPGVSTARGKTYASLTARIEDDEAVLVALAAGLVRNLRVANNATAPDSKLDVSFDAMGVVGANGLAVVTAFTATLDAAVTGVNGRDASLSFPLTASSWWRVWLIYNPTSAVAKLFLSADTATPTFPAGYTFRRRIGYAPTDAGQDFLRFRQVDHQVLYDLAHGVGDGATPGGPRLNNAVALTSTTIAAVSAAKLIPPGSRRGRFLGWADQMLFLYPGDTFQGGAGFPSGTGHYVECDLDTDASQNIKYKLNSAGNAHIECWGYYDPLG